MGRVIHFEIPVNDPEKAGAFYTRVFGWQIQKWGDHEYWLAATGEPEKPGINGALIKKRDPSMPVVNTIACDNLEATLQLIEANGGKVVVQKMGIPGVGWLAYFQDTEGNITGVMQDDPQAQ
jgi:uncharacterized protein